MQGRSSQRSDPASHGAARLGRRRLRQLPQDGPAVDDLHGTDAGPERHAAYRT